jgi:transcriptional regulator with XRE-family HTH domain
MDTLKRLGELLESRGLTMYQLSLVSGVPYSTLKNSQDRNGQLSVDTIERICRGLGISLSDFFEERGA